MCLKAVWKVCGGCLDGNLRKVVIQLNLVENLSKLTRFLSKFVYYKKGKVGFLTKFTGFCPNLKINIKFFRNYSGYNEGTKKILAHSLSGTGDWILRGDKLSEFPKIMFEFGQVSGQFGQKPVYFGQKLVYLDRFQVCPYWHSFLWSLKWILERRLSLSHIYI